MSFSIDSDARKQIERERLIRMLYAMSRTPTEGELRRLDIMLSDIDKRVTADNRFIAMHAITLSKKNLLTLDAGGFASLKADGIHAHLAFVTDSKVRVQDATERKDTALLVMRRAGGASRVLAVDRVLKHTDAKIILDGEVCLRKRQLSRTELLAIDQAQNVHLHPYIEYPSIDDQRAVAAGVDITSDVHQRQYDVQFEVVFAAFDCMFLVKQQANMSYRQRRMLVYQLTEVSPANPKTVKYKQSIERISAALIYAGGIDRLQLRIFLKPANSVQHISAAIHAVPACMHGIATDGVIFNPSESSYVVGVNEQLLKFKPEHTADFTILVTPTGQYQLCVRNDNSLVSVSVALLVDTPHAQRLVHRCAAPVMSDKTIVVECLGVKRDDGIWWRPVQDRSADKLMPNTMATYKNVIDAVDDQLTEEDIVASVHARARMRGN